MSGPAGARALACLVFVALLRAGEAGAASPAPSPPATDARARAEAFFRAGKAYFDAGNYEDAVVAYERSYAELPLPALLFNIGQCYRFLGKPDRAIFYFESYLYEEKDPKNAVAVRALIEELRKDALSKVRATGKPPVPPPPAEPALPPVPAESPGRFGPAPGAPGVSAAPATVAGTATVATPPSSKSVFGRWWFWTIVGGVAVGAGVGVGLALASGGERVPDTSLGAIDAR